MPLHELFKLNQKAGEMKALPEVMNQYLPKTWSLWSRKEDL